jgi:SepF-like predicted cell division protein (DUF552 family)
MPFNLFRKKKPEEEAPVAPQQPEQEQPQPESVTPPQEPEPVAPAEPAPEQVQTAVAEQQIEPTKEETIEPDAPSKTYLKAMPLRELNDLENVKSEVTNGNIIILKVTPLAQRSIEDVKTAVNDLYQFAENTGGDIARLGEERIVICPKTVRIWREKSPKPAVNEPLPTAA